MVAAESESFTPEEEVITDDDTLIDLPEETTEAAPVETPVETPVATPVETPTAEAPVTTPGAMVNQLFLPLAAR